MRFLMLVWLFVASNGVLADQIAIIGTGNVGAALGPKFAAQGHTITYGTRNPDREDVLELVARTGEGTKATGQQSAINGADIVVLAVPGLLVDEITRSLGDLSGKVIVDPTNPLVFDGKEFSQSSDVSNAEIIQAAAPSAFVVKAFNTLSWDTMVNPEMSGGPVSIPLVGDSDEAKARVAELVSGMGLDPIDLGPLRYAGWVEGMLMLWINNRMAGRETFDFHLRRTKSTP